ncbi:MAG: hypothetical protein K6U89_05355 [Chloroflexi bacterium]|nr:hypothetical protein [Chloroflexota bacterium]GIW09766.1 MAG: hypothetical protein KatS3mg061_0823 [Dehalococcoidia bacterium]
MPFDYQVLKVLHILLVMVWLGTDIATMAAFFGLLNPRFALTTRLAMSRLSDLMDMGPRSALVLLLMLGIYLTYRGEWGLSGPLGAPIAAASALIGVLWFGGVWHQYLVGHGRLVGPRHQAFQRGFRLFDLWWRTILSLVLAAAAAVSLLGQGGPVAAVWLSLKLILFAGIVLLGVYLRVLIPQIGAAVSVIVKHGSDPEREAALRRPAWRAIVAVWGIWVLIAAIVYLAVAKL